MKILYVNILYAPYLYGGAERTLQTLAEGMVARGHDVVVLTTGPDGGLHEEVINGVRVLRAGVRNLYWHAVRNKPSVWKRALWHLVDIYNPLMGDVVSKIVKEEKPDVVSFHNLPGFSVAVWDAVHRAKLPMVQVLHDQYLICPRCTMFRNGHVCEHQCISCRAMRFFHPRLSSKVSAVVGISRFILDHHLKHGYFRATPIRSVIHNARNNPQALSISRRGPDGTVRFGYIGTLDKSKGIELLLRVFTQIAKNNWELHIAGSGPADYEKFLHNFCAEPNVIFHGVQKPLDFYPGIDVLVVPSLWNEPLGVVVFEAMSYGVPVIGTLRGGIPEMIEDGKNGILFEPNRPEELKVALIRMADETFMDSASQAARAAAPYFLDMERFVSGYEELYGELQSKTQR
jgi:glycosyltransferase involved in cell wall biosynthesis